MDSDQRVARLMDSFRRIVQALRSSHRAAAYLNLTGAQLFVISVLHDAGVPLSVSELAARTRTDPSTVSVVVRRLVQRGLVQRLRAADDSRRAELTLTRKGQTLHGKAPVTLAQERLVAALEELSERDGTALERLLTGIVDVMGEADTPPPMLFDTEPAEERKRSKARRVSRRSG